MVFPAGSWGDWRPRRYEDGRFAAFVVVMDLSWVPELLSFLMKATAFVGMFIGLPAAVGVLIFQLWEWAFRKPEVINGAIRPLNQENDSALESGESTGLKLLTFFIPVVGGLVFQGISGMMLARRNKVRLCTGDGIRLVFLPRKLKAELDGIFFTQGLAALDGTMVVQGRYLLAVKSPKGLMFHQRDVFQISFLAGSAVIFLAHPENAYLAL